MIDYGLMDLLHADFKSNVSTDFFDIIFRRRRRPGQDLVPEWDVEVYTEPEPQSYLQCGMGTGLRGNPVHSFHFAHHKTTRAKH